MWFLPRVAVLIGLVSLLNSCLVLGAGDFEWSTRRIYFALTDRFARSDNSRTECSNLGKYCGGTWRGMKDRLGYIKELGFDAIWITPIVENTKGGYHGYWAKDIFKVNENYGTAQDLKDLVSAAHSMGIYVMVDVVMNHVGIGPFEDFPQFPNETFYHPYCLITDYFDQKQVEQCRFVVELPDLKTEDPYVRAVYQEWIRQLMREYKFDGLRIDTARHVEKSFYKGFLAAAGNPFAMGEVFHGDTKYVAGYQEVMSSVFNYPLYYVLVRTYAQSHHFQDLVNTHDATSLEFKNPHLLGTIVDNHDVPRFMSYTTDTTRLKNAMAYVILARGIPVVYYGTEYAYMGGHDPQNREDLWRMGYKTNGDMWNFIKTLNTVRAEAGGLGEDDHEHLMVEEGAYVFGRAQGKVLVLTTNKGCEEKEVKEYCFQVPGMEGRKYRAVLSGNEYKVQKDGYMCVQVEAGLPEVFVVGVSFRDYSLLSRYIY